MLKVDTGHFTNSPHCISHFFCVISCKTQAWDKTWMQVFIGELLLGNKGRVVMRKEGTKVNLKVCFFQITIVSSGENVQRLCRIVPLKDGCWSVYPLVHQLVFVDCRREDEYPCISVAIIFSLEASCCVSRGPGNESTMNLAEWEVGSCFFGVNKSWEKIDHSSIVQNVNVVG